MKKEDALNQFLEIEARAASSKFVFASMSCLDQEHKKATTAQFGDAMRHILREAPDLYFLQITLLRSKVLSGQPFYRLEAYGADLYLAEPLLQMEPPFDWLYDTYAGFTAELEEESRKYIFQIGKPELNRIKLAELYNCQRIVKHLFFRDDSLSHSLGRIPGSGCGPEYPVSSQ